MCSKMYYIHSFRLRCLMISNLYTFKRKRKWFSFELKEYHKEEKIDQDMNMCLDVLGGCRLMSFDEVATETVEPDHKLFLTRPQACQEFRMHLSLSMYIHTTGNSNRKELECGQRCQL